jgi:hypothetical protein
MEQYNFEMSDEAKRQLAELVERATEAAEAFLNALAEAIKPILDRLREIAIYFGRLFFKAQLLEWRISPRWAELISHKVYWYWACKIGYSWLNKHLLPLAL